MKSIRMGIDIDGTVTCPSTFVPYLNEAFQKDFTLEDITQYNLVPLLGVSEKEVAAWFARNEQRIYAESPLAEGAIDVLDDWKHEHEFFFISARGNHLLNTTKEWFEKHNIHFDHIELIGQHDKIKVAQNHDVDIFFEDKHDNAVEISEECDIPVILFDTPYNRNPIPDKVIRVYSWQEAQHWVENWKKSESLRREA
ncbi:hypothetical protein LC040_11165 [Bacillus tianshenii]|nr:hypothetical protein LC040_11165 [Bacillus tianshenii]